MISSSFRKDMVNHNKLFFKKTLRASTPTIAPVQLVSYFSFFSAFRFISIRLFHVAQIENKTIMKTYIVRFDRPYFFFSSYKPHLPLVCSTLLAVTNFIRIFMVPNFIFKQYYLHDLIEKSKRLMDYAPVSVLAYPMFFTVLRLFPCPIHPFYSFDSFYVLNLRATFLNSFYSCSL